MSDIYLVAPANRDTWQRVEEEDQAVQTAYWDSISWFNVLRGSLEDVAFAAQQLVAAHRSSTAVDLLASTYGAIPVDVVIQVLEAFPTDVTRDLAGDDTWRLETVDLPFFPERGGS